MQPKRCQLLAIILKMKNGLLQLTDLRIVVEDYDKTIFIEEALFRLVEIYYKIGLEDEAKVAAVLLGYNYNSE